MADEPFDHPLWVKRHPDSRLVYTFSYEKGSADRGHIGGTRRTPPSSADGMPVGPTFRWLPALGG